MCADGKGQKIHDSIKSCFQAQLLHIKNIIILVAVRTHLKLEVLHYHFYLEKHSSIFDFEEYKMQLCAPQVKFPAFVWTTTIIWVKEITALKIFGST